MQKYYLLMLLILSVAIPIRQASRATLEEAGRETFKSTLIFLLVWGYGVTYLYWKLPP